MVDSGWLALSVAVGTACRRHSVNHDVYFLSGKGVFKIQNIVEYSNNLVKVPDILPISDRTEKLTKGSRLSCTATQATPMPQ